MRLNLKFLRDAVDKIFDSALHEVHCSVVLLSGVFGANIETCHCMIVSKGWRANGLGNLPGLMGLSADGSYVVSTSRANKGL